MSHNLPLQSKKVIEGIQFLQRDKEAMRELGMYVFGKINAPVFPLDLVAFGAVKRNLSITTGIQRMIIDWNMGCARTLLRMHIDTSLRFSAAWLVENPQDFASKVIKGNQINKLKDKKGKPLTDAHLVQIRSLEYPWLTPVYEKLCGYVHFSALHIFDSAISLESEETINFEISENDITYLEPSWLEIINCSREATGILAKYIRGYAETKSLDPQKFALLKQKYSNQ